MSPKNGAGVNVINKKSDQNESVTTSRADALITDYLDEIFSSSPSFEDELIQSAEELSGNVVAGANPEDAKPGTAAIIKVEDASETSVEDDQTSGRETDDHQQTELSKPRFQHPNLKPASAILSARNAQSPKPFKSEEDKQEAVLTGLMPKFAPAEPKTDTLEQQGTKELESEPEVQQQAQVAEVLETTVEVATEVITEAEAEARVEIQTETKNDSETVEVTQTELAHESVMDVGVSERLSEKVEEPVAELEEQVSDLEEPPAAAPPLKTSQFRELPEFEMLLFDVRGLQLAVPLISLGSIHRLEDDFTPIVGRAEWYLGMYRVSGRNLQVVDTARWVMPSRMQVESDQPYEFVIRLADTNWALACTGVQQAMRISNEEIKWRTQQGKRPWLAGTVISKMCALLDVESMARLLDENKLQQSM